MLDQLKRMWTSLSASRKIILVSACVFCLAVILFLVVWAGRVPYRPLYTNLNPDDAAAILSQLKAQKIPYKLTDSGTTILIPQDKVYETRLALASKGLPQGGGIGFEIFDQSKLGVTEFVQKINYVRALQGELARTINQLSEVSRCRVHISLPEKSLFVEQQKPAKASVVLKLKPGMRLNQNQIRGIAYLVASSVEGLSPENVTIIDEKGSILTTKMEGNGAEAVSSNNQELQEAIERRLERKVQTILERVVGPGKVVARVSAKIDFTAAQQTEEKYDPNAVVRSEQHTEEKSSSTKTATGVPGVASNIPGQGLTAKKTQPPQNQFKKTSDTINYEISKVVTKKILPPGEIKSLSVAVLLDGTYEMKKGKDGKEVRTYVPRSDEEMKKLENLVKNAIGFNPDRGDKVSVVNIPFETMKEEEVKVSFLDRLLSREVLLPAAKYVTILLLFFLFYLFIFNPFLKWLKEQQLALPGAQGPPLLAEGGYPISIALSPEVQKITVLARTNVDEMVELIRSLLKETSEKESEEA